MGLQAYALRAEYADYQGGSVAYGPDAYHFDVGQALKDGGGKIHTDDTLLQAALENIDGGNGPLFKKVSSDENPVIAGLPKGAVPVVATGQDPEQSETAQAPPPGEVPPPEPTPGQEAPSNSSPDNSSANVKADSEYEHLGDSELRDEVKARGLTVKQGASAEDLAAALEADDAKRGEKA